MGVYAVRSVNNVSTASSAGVTAVYPYRVRSLFAGGVLVPRVRTAPLSQLPAPRKAAVRGGTESYNFNPFPPGFNYS